MALEDAKNPVKGVSGPGKYAKRTDRIPANSYGDQTDLANIASGAPLAKAPEVPGSQRTTIPVAPMPTAPTPVTSLFAPSERPHEPVTAGTDRGPGPGSEVLMMRKSPEKLSDILVKMLPYDSDGSIAILYQNALARGN